jgi:hypothetical protein
VGAACTSGEMAVHHSTHPHSHTHRCRCSHQACPTRGVGDIILHAETQHSTAAHALEQWHTAKTQVTCVYSTVSSRRDTKHAMCNTVAPTHAGETSAIELLWVQWQHTGLRVQM